MVHKSHEIPLPKGPRNYEPPKPKSRASIAALAWAADKKGQSYGVFIQRLTPEDEARIQEEFEAYKAERDAEAATRRAVRVGDEQSTVDEFIITDKDV